MTEADQDPREAALRHALAAARIVRERGDEADARASELEVLRLAPPGSAVAREAVLMIGASGNFRAFPELLGHTTALYAARPDDAQVAFLHSYVLWVARRTPEAIVAVRRAIALRSIPQYVMHYAFYCATSGRIAEAIRAAEILTSQAGSQYADMLRFYRAVRDGTELEASLGAVRLLFEPTASNSQFVDAGIHHAGGNLMEPVELAHVAGWVPRGGTVAEVGLSVGNHFLFFGKALQPARLIGVEANPVSAALVARNLARNRAADPAGWAAVSATIHTAAAGARDDRTTIETTESGPVEVPLRRLATLLADEPPLRFLKIDVDGPELEVLEGARPLLVRDRPRLMIEVDAANLAAFRTMMDALDYKMQGAVQHGGSLFANYFYEPR